MKLRSHLYCLITILLWSTIEIVGKLIGDGINPFAITAWRFILGGLVLLPFGLRQAHSDKIRLTYSSILQISALGILNVVCSMLLLQLAIYYGKASLAAIIVSMNPLFVSIFGWLIINEKLTRYNVISLLIGFFGLVAILISEPFKSDVEYSNVTLGILFALLASVTFGLYTILSKKYIQKYGNFTTNSIAFLSGGVTLSTINILIGKPMLFSLGFVEITSLLYLGFLISGFAYVLYFESMRVLTASVASRYFFLKPAIAVFLASIVLKERVEFLQIIGIILVMLSLSRSFFEKPTR